MGDFSRLLFDVSAGAFGMIFALAGLAREKSPLAPAGRFFVSVAVGVFTFGIAHASISPVQLASIPVVLLAIAAMILVPSLAAFLFFSFFLRRVR